MNIREHELKADARYRGRSLGGCDSIQGSPILLTLESRFDVGLNEHRCCCLRFVEHHSNRTLTTSGEMITMNELGDILEAIGHGPIAKRAITNHGMLNEAYSYAKPSSFSRGMRIDINGLTILLISGTASIDENLSLIHISE